jgi:hypothetical protein
MSRCIKNISRKVKTTSNLGRNEFKVNFILKDMWNMSLSM